MTPAEGVGSRPAPARASPRRAAWTSAHRPRSPRCRSSRRPAPGGSRAAAAASAAGAGDVQGGVDDLAGRVGAGPAGALSGGNRWLMLSHWRSLRSLE